MKKEQHGFTTSGTGRGRLFVRRQASNGTMTTGALTVMTRRMVAGELQYILPTVCGRDGETRWYSERVLEWDDTVPKEVKGVYSWFTESHSYGTSLTMGSHSVTCHPTIK